MCGKYGKYRNRIKVCGFFKRNFWENLRENVPFAGEICVCGFYVFSRNKRGNPDRVIFRAEKNAGLKSQKCTEIMQENASEWKMENGKSAIMQKLEGK